MFKKIAFPIFLCSLCINLVGNQAETSIKGNVKVVQNRLRPLPIKGKPSQLILNSEFIIDLADPILAEAGLTDPVAFDLDSVGNIYVWNQSSNEDFIFKFSSDGRFLASFGRKGQGPGELQVPTSLSINSNDDLENLDPERIHLR